MTGTTRTRNRLLEQWADVAQKAKQRYHRSLLRQGYGWAVCIERTHSAWFSDEPEESETREVLAFCRSDQQAWAWMWRYLRARGSRPDSSTSGCFSYSYEFNGIQYSTRAVVYLVDLSDEDDAGWIFRCLE